MTKILILITLILFLIGTIFSLIENKTHSSLCEKISTFFNCIGSFFISLIVLILLFHFFMWIIGG